MIRRTRLPAIDWPVDFGTRGKVVLSDNEPADLMRYARWGNFRLRRFENNLVIYLTPRDDEKPGETAGGHDRIKESVSDQAEVLLAYLRWRLERATRFRRGR